MRAAARRAWLGASLLLLLPGPRARGEGAEPPWDVPPEVAWTGDARTAAPRRLGWILPGVPPEPVRGRPGARALGPTHRDGYLVYRRRGGFEKVALAPWDPEATVSWRAMPDGTRPIRVWAAPDGWRLLVHGRFLSWMRWDYGGQSAPTPLPVPDTAPAVGVNTESVSLPGEQAVFATPEELLWIEADGSVARRLALPRVDFLALSRAAGVLLAVRRDGTVHCLGPDGALRWVRRLPGPLRARPVAGARHAWIVGKGGLVHALALADGRLVRSMALPEATPLARRERRHRGIGFVPGGGGLPAALLLLQWTALLPGDRLAVAWPTGGLTVLEPHRGVLWHRSRPRDEAPVVALLGDAAGQLLLLHGDGLLQLLDQRGERRWRRRLAIPPRSPDDLVLMQAGPPGWLLLLDRSDRPIPLRFRMDEAASP